MYSKSEYRQKNSSLLYETDPFHALRRSMKITWISSFSGAHRNWDHSTKSQSGVLCRFLSCFCLVYFLDLNYIILSYRHRGFLTMLSQLLLPHPGIIQYNLNHIVFFPLVGKSHFPLIVPFVLVIFWCLAS